MSNASKQIAIIYYTQSGQLKDIADRLISLFPENYNIDFLQIVPVKAIPFPWKPWVFYDTMPECVTEEGIEIDLLGWQEDRKYDLVIMAFQPWFLSPSQPTTGFLKSNFAAQIFKGSKVLTLIGARNMWLNAQEKVKARIIQHGGTLVGNIAFVDTMPNLISTLTVFRWAFKGQKEAGSILPAAGVQEEELLKAPIYGQIVSEAIASGDFSLLQNKLVNVGAVKLKPGLILLEQTGIGQFRKWARRIQAKGGPLSPERKPLVVIFKNLLVYGIFILTPVKAVTSTIQTYLKRKKLAQDRVYFLSTEYKENAL